MLARERVTGVVEMLVWMKPSKSRASRLERLPFPQALSEVQEKVRVVAVPALLTTWALLGETMSAWVPVASFQEVRGREWFQRIWGTKPAAARGGMVLAGWRSVVKLMPMVCGKAGGVLVLLVLLVGR